MKPSRSERDRAPGAWLALLLWCCSLAPAVAGALPVVTDGKATAVVVIPDRSTEVVRYAAQELAYHVAKGTGAKLEIVAEEKAGAESGTRIYLGNCRATQQAGVATGKLAPESFILRVTDQAVFITGDDGGGDPLDQSTRAGTLFGVYEWLESALKVRWLWPGELGTYVPESKTVVAETADQQTAPRFFQRRLRAGQGFTSEHPALGFTPGAAQQFAQEQAVFLRRHRMGRGYPAGYGHAFTDWWKTDGKAHPEWFQLRADGKRGPSKPTARFSMCVSNPDFQREVVKRWEAKQGGRTGTPAFINAVENDILGLCTCAACRAWDGPTPPDHLTFYSPKSKMVGAEFVSDRYARFWLAIQQAAAQKHPDATVIGYVYFNYFAAPTSGVKLNSNVLLGFCPSAGWFPRSAEEHDWMKRQWTGWRATGARLFLRSNHLLDGYCMPYIFAHQFADEFQNCVRQGMVATDLDSLTGHWATQGPTLYVATRLHVRPEANVDAMLDEYYSGFGAAAPLVKKYFAYWESFTADHREQTDRVMDELQTSRWRNWAKAAHAVFPPASFLPAEAMLREAAALSRDEKEAAKRIEFLQLGLAHAKLCAQVAGRLSLANPVADKAEAKKVLDELLTFRRQHERSGIGNFNHLAWVEDLSWKLSDESKQAPELYP